MGSTCPTSTAIKTFRNLTLLVSVLFSVVLFAYTIMIYVASREVITPDHLIQPSPPVNHGVTSRQLLIARFFIGIIPLFSLVSFLFAIWLFITGTTFFSIIGSLFLLSMLLLTAITATAALLWHQILKESGTGISGSEDLKRFSLVIGIISAVMAAFFFVALIPSLNLRLT